MLLLKVWKEEKLIDNLKINFIAVMNILEQIVAHKRKEVEQRKKEVEVKELESNGFLRERYIH